MVDKVLVLCGWTAPSVAGIKDDVGEADDIFRESEFSYPWLRGDTDRNNVEFQRGRSTHE